MEWETRLKELIVRTRPEKHEIEITQDHIEDAGSVGVCIGPDQVDQLKELLEMAVDQLAK